MLKKRIIPSLLILDGELVKGEQFNSWRRVGNPVQAMRVPEMRGVDEVVLLDIGATPNKTRPNFDLIREISDNALMPLSVGGGVRTLDDIQELLRAGADKVVIGTAGIAGTGLFEEAVKKFGGSTIVAAIDVKDGRVYSHCGRFPTLLYPLNVAVQVADIGVGEILLTAIDRDGMLTGYDLNLIARVAALLSIPVIAAGGGRDARDFALAFDCGAHAVAAGAAFQFTGLTPLMAAQELDKRGYEVRV